MGGNFGDLYPDCHLFRIEIIKKYTQNRIILFPQSVYYSDRELAGEHAKWINAHPDIHICVRDSMSYNFLSEYVEKCKLHLLPDMAFFLEIFPTVCCKNNKTVAIMRVDSERKKWYSEDIMASFADGEIVVKDWPTIKTTKLGKALFFYLSVIEFNLSSTLSRYKLSKWLVHPEYGLKRRKKPQEYIDIGVKSIDGYGKVISPGFMD